MSRTVFMFSGQGSHYFQMGRDLYENNQTFRDCLLRLDTIFRAFSNGASVIQTLYSPDRRKSDVFDRTLLTHSAIFMVEYALAQTLIRAGLEPDLVLGASLGAFVAAAVAGILREEDAVTGVIHQAAAIEESSEPGGMIAILAEPSLFEEIFLQGNSELVGVNFASQFVVSGRPPQLVEIEAELKRRSVSYWRLPVSHPFHSRWIDGAESRFAVRMRQVKLNMGRMPMACCSASRILSSVSEGYFWKVVRQPIYFRETIASLEETGSHTYLDLGPSGTLATFLRHGFCTSSGSTVHTILTPYGFDQKKLEAVLESRPRRFHLQRSVKAYEAR